MGELAELGGVSRRTVRYYVQEGLLAIPHGLGRGAYYDPEHLEQLVRVKAMQEQGLALEVIRSELGGEGFKAEQAKFPYRPSRSHWTRVELLPGVELHISSGRRVPSPRKLQELDDWCRRAFRPGEDTEENDG